MRDYYYEIAGEGMLVRCPSDKELSAWLPSFTDFQTLTYQNPCCKVELRLKELPAESGRNKTLLSDYTLVWKDNFRIYEVENGYEVRILANGSKEGWCMLTSKDFTESTIYLPEENEYLPIILNWFLMVAFGQSIIKNEVILFHASVVMLEGKGIAFLGKSGTGKSTHSQQWLSAFSSSELLNDDNPAIALEDDGSVWVYGTPWSGKTPCYKNKGAPLAGLVRLEQYPRNEMKRLVGAEALIGVLPSCTSIRWNKDIFGKMNQTLTTILENVPVGHLKCLPNQQAAEVCKAEVWKWNNDNN